MSVHPYLVKLVAANGPLDYICHDSLCKYTYHEVLPKKEKRKGTMHISHCQEHVRENKTTNWN